MDTVQKEGKDGEGEEGLGGEGEEGRRGRLMMTPLRDGSEQEDRGKRDEGEGLERE